MLASGVAPSVDVHNALMDAYGKAFQVSRAVNVLDDMRKSKNTLPDHISYGTIFHAAGQAGDTDLALHLFMQARREGLVPSEAMCDMLLLAILKRIRAGKLIAGTAAWIPKAVYIYRECVVAGVRPGPKTLNKVLACLRHTKYSKGYQEQYGGLLTPPAPSAMAPTGLFGTPKNIMKAMGRGGRAGGAVGGSYGSARMSFGSPHNTQRLGQLSSEYTVDEYDAHGLYESPALALYEESQRLGTVPAFQLHRGGKVDLRDHPKDAAQVAVLALVKHIRQRVDRPDARIGSLTLQLKTLKVSPEELREHEEMWNTAHWDDMQEERFRLDNASVGARRPRPLRSDDVVNGRRSSLSGAAVAKLLRHLDIPYKGSAATGELLVTGKVLSRWMQRSSQGTSQSHFLGANASQWHNTER
jgi:pentatricopeptide repeat protein